MTGNSSQTLSGRPFYRVVSVLLLLALCLAAFPQTSPALAKGACKFKYKVQSGDTVAYIAFLYSINWMKIVEANDLTPPYTLSIGQVLCIPEGATAPTETSTSTSSGSKKAKEKITVFASFDSLLVSVENFPKLSIYYVRVFKKSNMVGYRIGRMRTNKEGKASERFKVPGFMAGVKNPIVCLKNVRTDEAICSNYVNETAPASIYWVRVKKVGR